jgi:hypothetical protein
MQSPLPPIIPDPKKRTTWETVRPFAGYFVPVWLLPLVAMLVSITHKRELMMLVVVVGTVSFVIAARPYSRKQLDWPMTFMLATVVPFAEWIGLVMIHDIFQALK